MNSYEAFDTFTREYMFDLMVHTAALQNIGGILTHLKIENQLRAAALTLANEIRQYMFGGTLGNITEESRHKLNRERWKPYDSAAWDTFFAGFIAYIQPHVQNLKNTVASLPEHELGQKIQEHLSELDRLLETMPFQKSMP